MKRTIQSPSFSYKNDNSLKILKVEITPDETVLYMSNNNKADGGYYSWVTISPNTSLVSNSRKYKLQYTYGIEISPNVTYYKYQDETINFELHFPPIPINAISIDFMENIETPEDGWYIKGIQLN